MTILKVCKHLNQLKRERVINDWALIGSVAAMHYIGPMNTIDVDVVLVVDSDEEWITARNRTRQRFNGTLSGRFIVIENIIFDILTADLNPIYGEAVKEAKTVRADGVRVRISPPEHLIIMSLIAFRPEKDWGRIVALLAYADEGKLTKLLERYDDAEEVLTRRLNQLRRLHGRGD